MNLYIGNKLYSSWSLRPWLLMKACGIPFEETVIPLFDSEFKERIHAISGAGRVPVLMDGDIKVWESLAIVEYLHEKFPGNGIWPTDEAARAHARAAASEMHASFGGLRSACPMNLGKRYATRDRGSDVAADVARFEELWGEARSTFARPSGKPFLYGEFCAADAMFAPVATRLDTYGIQVSTGTRDYINAILAHPSFNEWKQAALQEPWILAEDEVDEEPIENYRPHLS